MEKLKKNSIILGVNFEEIFLFPKFGYNNKKNLLGKQKKNTITNPSFFAKQYNVSDQSITFIFKVFIQMIYLSLVVSITILNNWSEILINISKT